MPPTILQSLRKKSLRVLCAPSTVSTHAQWTTYSLTLCKRKLINFSDNFKLIRIRGLPPLASLLLVQALLEQLPEGTSPVVIVVKPDMPSAALPRSNGTRTSPHGSVYDPAIIYLLELATLIALQSEESVTVVGPAVAEALQNLVRDAANMHPLIASRATLYLLHLLSVSHVSRHIPCLTCS